MFGAFYRSQLSYGRYWEGRLQLQTMTARWADFCTEVSTKMKPSSCMRCNERAIAYASPECKYKEKHAFARVVQALMMDAGTLSSGIQSDPKAWNRAKWFTETTVHLSSLLHGVALQHLRSDWDLSNLTTYHSIDPAPPLVSPCNLIQFACHVLQAMHYDHRVSHTKLQMSAMHLLI